jgi:hypothetical protein
MANAYLTILDDPLRHWRNRRNQDRIQAIRFTKHFVLFFMSTLYTHAMGVIEHDIMLSNIFKKSA